MLIHFISFIMSTTVNDFLQILFNIILRISLHLQSEVSSIDSSFSYISSSTSSFNIFLSLSLSLVDLTTSSTLIIISLSFLFHSVSSLFFWLTYHIYFQDKDTSLNISCFEKINLSKFNSRIINFSLDDIVFINNLIAISWFILFKFCQSLVIIWCIDSQSLFTFQSLVIMTWMIIVVAFLKLYCLNIIIIASR